MQKISSILPSNTRVTTVDIKASGAVRGGMPAFGREVGVTAAAEKKVQLEAAAQLKIQNPTQVLHKEQMQLRKENSDPKALIVSEMARKFFMKSEKPAAEDMQMAVDENSDLVAATAAPMDAIAGTNEVSAADESAEIGLVDLSQISSSQPVDDEENFLIVGGNLDVRA